MHERQSEDFNPRMTIASDQAFTLISFRLRLQLCFCGLMAVLILGVGSDSKWHECVGGLKRYTTEMKRSAFLLLNLGALWCADQDNRGVLQT